MFKIYTQKTVNMKTKPKLLFWLNGFLLHFSLAYYLQSKLDAYFYGLIDINSKPKKFFQNQTLVNFEKIWFFHDYIKKTHQILDTDYLSDFEKKYKINLWKLALNERFFYKHNHFYKFPKEEILSILEQELKLFESILDEVKPNYFLTYDPVFHHQKLLLDICKARGIKIVSIYYTGIKDKMILATNGETLDLDKNSLENLTHNKIQQSNNEKISYDSVWHDYLKNKSPKFSNKLKAFMVYLLNSDSELTTSNFMYYGRSKFKVTKDAITLELKRRRNFRFLQKSTTLSPDLNIPYVYFPMNINEEMNLLHYAPYYTNQIEVIRHITKSVPIDYVVYVKDHIGAGLRGWNDIDYYKEIMEIPNVTLIHPQFDNNILLQNSQLLITVRGTTTLKAVKYGKPSIIFGQQPFEILPSVFRVGSLKEFPDLIKKALNCKVNPLDYEKYEKLIDNQAFEFNMFEYENNRNKTFFSGSILSNVLIHEKDMINFLDKNKGIFTNLANEHLKLLS